EKGRGLQDDQGQFPLAIGAQEKINYLVHIRFGRALFDFDLGGPQILGDKSTQAMDNGTAEAKIFLPKDQRSGTMGPPWISPRPKNSLGTCSSPHHFKGIDTGEARKLTKLDPILGFFALVEDLCRRPIVLKTEIHHIDMPEKTQALLGIDLIEGFLRPPYDGELADQGLGIGQGAVLFDR